MASNSGDFLGSAGAKMWVSGATYAQGKFAISLSDFTLYIRKVAGAGATDPANDTANWQPFGQRPVKSTQFSVVSIGTGAGSGTAAITAVNVAKSELYFLGSSDTSGTGIGIGRLTGFTSTTVGAANGGGAGSIGFMIIERY